MGVEVDFIKPQVTTSTEVREKLKLLDTGLLSNRYFLARWASSSSAGWLVTGGAIGTEDTGGRAWKSGNLLVEFDSNGLVLRVEENPDSKIISALASVAAEIHLSDSPVELSVKYWKNGYRSSIPARIILSHNVFSFEELGIQKRKHKFVVSRSDVLSISTPISKPNGDPVYTTQTLHFATHLKKLGGPSEKEINIEVSLPGLVDLLSYISQHSGAVSDARNF